MASSSGGRDGEQRDTPSARAADNGEDRVHVTIGHRGSGCAAGSDEAKVGWEWPGGVAAINKKGRLPGVH